MLERSSEAERADGAAAATLPVELTGEQIDVEAIGETGLAPDHEYEAKRLGLFFWLCVGWLALLLTAVVFADLLPLKDPNQTFSGTFREGPTAEHWFGSDNIGKDVFARTIYGARWTLGISLTATLIGFVVGGLFGMLAGYYQGRIEGSITGGIDVLLAFPALILALIVSIFVGQTELPVLQEIGGSPNKALTIALGLLSIPTIARITRAGVLVNTEREFVLASRTVGARDLRIMVREVLPNVLPSMVAFALIGVSFLIIVQAALAFLGVGDLNQPNWGVMISLGRDQLDEAPHMVLFPSLFMFFTILAINYIGDRLREVGDVREGAL